MNRLMRIFRATLFLFTSLCAVFAQEPSKKPNSPSAAPAVGAGTITSNVYRNPDLGITYKIILGWVDRTSQIQGDPALSGRVLLAIFEHPPEVKGDNINSAVIIAAESRSSYPGVKTPTDYFDTVTEAATSQGFKVVNEPYEIMVGAKPLMRSDFSKEIGKLTMHQSSLVMLSKGYAVSFTFIGGSEDEVEQLIERLSFAPAKR